MIGKHSLVAVITSYRTTERDIKWVVREMNRLVRKHQGERTECATCRGLINR